jgi:hypothetical protein
MSSRSSTRYCGRCGRAGRSEARAVIGSLRSAHFLLATCWPSWNTPPEQEGVAFPGRIERNARPINPPHRTVTVGELASELEGMSVARAFLAFWQSKTLEDALARQASLTDAASESVRPREVRGYRLAGVHSGGSPCARRPHPGRTKQVRRIILTLGIGNRAKLWDKQHLQLSVVKRMLRT